MPGGGQRNSTDWWGKPELVAKDAGIEGADSRRTWLGDATSWLTACVTEGFAAYAHAPHPCLGEDGRWLGRDPIQSHRLMRFC